MAELGEGMDTDVTTPELSLLEELILMLLNEQTGYFHQVDGWNLNCAVAGAVLAELSLRSRIDTDLDSLILLDAAETGDPLLDSALREIADEPVRRDAQYWIERLAGKAEPIIDRTLDRLVGLNILEHHPGEFWTLARATWRDELSGSTQEGTIGQLVRVRVVKALFSDEIPEIRTILVICLVDTCDIFRFMFELDEQTNERIELICKMDLIGRSIAKAVKQNINGLLRRHTAVSRQIPRVPLRRLLFDPNLRKGFISAAYANLAKEYGPVFEIRLPVGKPLIFLAGLSTNQWVHRNGRAYLKTGPCLDGIEKAYGATGILPTLDGAEHFRLRKAYTPTCSRAWLTRRLDPLFELIRKVMADWAVGETYQARSMCRRLINGQVSPLQVGVESQDLLDDLVSFKERVLAVHGAGVLPEFTLKTPAMKRRAKAVEEMFERVRNVHTRAQRAGCPRNLADDVLSLHASDPLLMPEANVRFALSATGVLSVYFGDMLSFAIYDMVTQPRLHDKIRSEADALFDNGDPDSEDFTPSAIDVTHRFIQESLRMHPVLPTSLRAVVNSCVVEGYELPVGSRVCIVHSATHHMEEVFPDPCSFDIDRYLPPHSAHRGLGFAPYGLGTHTCPGIQQATLYMVVNLLMIAHYFDISVSPPNYALRYNPFPTVKPTRRLKFHVAGQRRELPA